MSTPSGSNPDSFQQFLASAYAVQQSGMDAQSLTALRELQQSLAAGGMDVDQIMQLVADHALGVANATGIALGTLKGYQLVFRAGSGCAAAYVGQHVTAVLSVSAHNESRDEILRVENAQTDTRIVADICRQFEAQALLVLPIYHDHTVAGVLEVLFSEAHAFQESELRAYRLMAAMLEEAAFGSIALGREKPPMRLPRAIEQITAPIQESSSADEHVPAPIITYPIISERRIRIPLHNFHMSAAVTGVIAALVIVAGWIVYDHRQVSPANTSSPLGSALQTTAAVEQKTVAAPSKPIPSRRSNDARSAADETEPTKTPGSAFRRVWVGPNEVDYVSENVTIRHFINATPPRPQMQNGYREVQIGKDVTVRYFETQSALRPPARPVSAAAQSVEHSATVLK
jgi:hypothetical protein